MQYPSIGLGLAIVLFLTGIIYRVMPRAQNNDNLLYEYQ